MKGDISLSAYVTAPDVKRLSRSGSELRRFVNKAKRMGFSKVYVENYRDGLLLEQEEVRRVRDSLGKEFSVAGGMALGTWGPGWGESEDFGFKVACLGDERNVKLSKQVLVMQAENFDQIIIDDFWAQWCYTNNDVVNFNARYDKSLSRDSLLRELARGDPEISALWAAYSVELLEQISREMLSEAREINKKIKIILKVAEWREQFLHRGISLSRLSKLFDGIFVGTESREYTSSYGSLHTLDVVRSIVGESLKGAWVDTLDGLTWSESISPSKFIEELRFSSLGNPEELVIFDYSALMEREELLTRTLPEVEKLREWVKLSSNREGIKVLGLQSSMRKVFDSYMEERLALIGIPISVVSPGRLRSNDLLLVTEDCLTSVDLMELHERGVNMLFTSSAVERAVSTSPETILSLLGLRDVVEKSLDGVAFVERGKGHSRGHRIPFGFPVGPIFDVEKAETLLQVFDGVKVWPVISRHRGRSLTYALGVTKYLPYLVEIYPEIVRDVLRRIVGEHVGVWMEAIGTTLSGVCMILEENRVTLLNLKPFSQRFRLRSKKRTLGEPIMGAARILERESNDPNDVEITILPHSIDAFPLT